MNTRGIEMNKTLKVIITCIVSFIIAYLVVGYVKNGMLVGIRWVENVTIWDKLREYYIRTASTNIIPTFIIAIILTTVVGLTKKK
jgi:putative effector of murein hydrolase LrgA (UPF0299 family)